MQVMFDDFLSEFNAKRHGILPATQSPCQPHDNFEEFT